MALHPAETFLNNIGIKGLKRFQEMCNNGSSVEDLSRTFKVSIPEISRVRSAMFTKKYVLSEHTKRFIAFSFACLQDIHEQGLQIIEEEKRVYDELTFIEGGKTNEEATQEPGRVLGAKPARRLRKP